MIEAEGLVKQYGPAKAVNKISFSVAEQETLVLLGTSGCGKTTTLKMLNRLIEPDRGTISIGGRDIATQSPEELRRGIGYVLQSNGLFPHYTVAENIAIVPRLLKWDKRKTQNRANELVKKLHLPADIWSKFPAELSGGQQQRVGLARALIADAPILLMDEPFGALDTITRSKIQQEFKQLDELKRKTIVMVTHDVQEAFELADRICLMDNGKIIQTGTPAELLFSPASPFVTAFLQAQHLHLEFKAIKLADLWCYFSNTNADNRPAIPAQQSVWAVLEQLKEPHQNSVLIEHNHERRIVTLEQLMTAFYQYKNSRYE